MSTLRVYSIARELVRAVHVLAGAIDLADHVAASLYKLLRSRSAA